MVPQQEGRVTLGQRLGRMVPPTLDHVPEPMVAPSPMRSSLTLVMVLRPPMEAPGPMDTWRTVSTLGPI